MTELVVIQDDKRYSEQDKIKINGKVVTIQHITLSGFLYNNVADEYAGYVTVVNGDKQDNYYSAWDFLVFVKAVVEVL